MYKIYMSCELGDGPSLPESHFTKLKEWFTKRCEADRFSDHPSEGQIVTGHGRERFNLDAAIFYGKRAMPITLAMAIIAVGPGMNPEFISVLPQALVFGLSFGVVLSVIFGLEKRRYL